MSETKQQRIQKMGPKSEDHPTVGDECPACHEEFEPGDYTTLISLGPGDDEKQKQKAKEGKAYNAVATEVHYECATGVPPEEAD